jgi:hypothetical protein
MWQDDRGKGPAAEHVNDYQFPLSFYVVFIICLYNFIEITLFLLKLYVVLQAMWIMIPPMRRGFIHALIRCSY